MYLFLSLSALLDRQKNILFFLQINMDICTHVGFTILHYAKLWMLMFHFDFLDR